MIFKVKRQFLALFKTPRKREVFSWRKTASKVYRHGLIYLYAFFVLLAPFAQTKVAFAPITVVKKVEAKIDDRPTRLASFLAEYDSPLVPYAKKFISVADTYGLDWRLLPAIAGTESTFGLHYIIGTYNPFGWGSGRIRFSSFGQAIETVGRTLYEKYYKFGTRDLTIEQVGDIYAESPHWHISVRNWIKRINAQQLSTI